jgi:hypothetical protein
VIDYQTNGTEQLDLLIHRPTQFQNPQIDTRSPKQANHPKVQRFGEQPSKPISTQDVAPIEEARAARSDTVIDERHDPASAAKHKSEVALELECWELKLFKNMTIRVIPPATPLKPLMSTDSDVNDALLSAAVHDLQFVEDYPLIKS